MPHLESQHKARDSRAFLGLLPAGLPVCASCCWNGLTILAAEPFRRGIRVRSHIEASSSSSSSSVGRSECRASECSLLCEDFARLGFDRVVVDAGVQVAYDWGLAREMMAGEAAVCYDSCYNTLPACATP
jgi:alpha-1,3-mannosyltransferase